MRTVLDIVRHAAPTALELRLSLYTIYSILPVAQLHKCTSTHATVIALVVQARTAKAVRTVLDIVGRAAPTALELQLSLCTEVIGWCNAEKRTFLRQRVQSRLALLLFQQGRYRDAVALVDK